MKVNPGYREWTFAEESFDAEYLEYRKKWSEFPNNDIRSVVPLHIDFEITTRCNLRCPFCPLQKMKIPRQDMELHLLSKVLTECAPRGTVACKLNWRGEPSCNPELPKFIESAKRLGIREVMINTNGLILNERLLKAYTKYLDKLIISVDSIQPETYAKLRVGGSLEAVIYNIQAVLDRRQGKPWIRVQKIDLPETRDEDFVGFWRDFGVDQVAINSYKEKGDTGITPVNTDACAQLWQRLVIAVDGSVYPCCEGYRLGSRGNTKKESIEKMWNSDKINEWRNIHLKGHLEKLACKNCTLPTGRSYCGER